jgi:uncharacterized protein (DUF2147 family)
MTQFLSHAAAFFLAASFILAPLPASAAEPLGIWLTQAGDARIRIARCGKNICGTIVWLREAIDPLTGKLQVDDKNPDPKLQNRKLVGVRLFSFAPSGSGWSGNIYNADDGKTYEASIAARDDNHIEVRGCAGPFCGSETWTRVPGR